jgi:thioredoxin-like negative regulator of GroEL
MHPGLRNGLNRWIVVSRYDPETDEAFLEHMRNKDWLTLLDPDSTFYVDYKIIATPTVTIAGAAGKVTAVHPGYDPGMIQDVRIELADLLGVTLPKAVSGAIEAPNMNLQMARRLAARGLYQRALSYYEKAAESGPLSPAAQLEIAEVYLKAGKPQEALKILAPLSVEQVDPDRLNALREQAKELQRSDSGELTPPKIYR